MAMDPSRAPTGTAAGPAAAIGASSAALVVKAGRGASDCRQRATEASAVIRVRRGSRTAAPAVAVNASLSGASAISARRAPAVVASLGPSCAPGAVASVARKGLSTSSRATSLR
jgi:hypothetical protein